MLRAQASDQNKVCSLSGSQLQMMATGTHSNLVNLGASFLIEDVSNFKSIDTIGRRT